MGKFYFFKSSSSNDVISGITIFSKSFKRAYSLAIKTFKNNNCKGVPQVLSI